MSEKNNNLIGIIGDPHFKEVLGYSDYISDGRKEEEKEILDFIAESLSDCNTIVFLGDQFHARSSSSHIVKKLLGFLERFDGKEIYIRSGNHDKLANGRSTMDFLEEVKNKKWNIITRKVLCKDSMVFCPYFSRTEVDAEDNTEASKKIMEMLDGGDFLFIHHALTGTSNESGLKVDFFPEPVLPKSKLEQKYKKVFGGHIHSPQIKGNTIVAGSIFNNEVGETQKYIWKLNKDTTEVEQIKLPGRGIYKLENPSDKDLDKIDKGNIVKVILTKKLDAPKLGELKEKLGEFDAYLLLEQVPSERKRVHFKKGEKLLEFSTDQLLETYAKMKDVDLNKLKKGFELIK